MQTECSSAAACFMVGGQGCCPLWTTVHYRNSRCFNCYFSDQHGLTFQVFYILTRKAIFSIFILSISESWRGRSGDYHMLHRTWEPQGICDYPVCVRGPGFSAEKCSPCIEFFLLLLRRFPQIWTSRRDFLRPPRKLGLTHHCHCDTFFLLRIIDSLHLMPHSL